MLQRHRRPNLQELIAVAREQLEDDLTVFLQPQKKKSTLTQTAQKIFTMYSNLSSPLIGTQIIKQQAIANKHPHSLQLQMILEKAQLFYLESVSHDLTKLREEQKILYITPEDIKQYVQEINWKLGYDRQSILNQSQEIGDNIDLMKFFEGVRNYQNVFENSQKTCIQKLKSLAIQTEKQLTLKKGFLAGKVASIHERAIAENNCYVFNKLKNIQRYSKKLSKLDRIYKKRLSDTFLSIFKKSQAKSEKIILKQIFNHLGNKIQKKQLIKGFKDIRKIKSKTSKFYEIVVPFFNGKKIIQENDFFRRISTKRQIKVMNWSFALSKLTKISKKKALGAILKVFGIPAIPITNSIHNLYQNNLKVSFENIKQLAIFNNNKKHCVSERVKGKILLSLSKHQNKPMNLRKTFLNWYLKGHQQNYTKKMYNIWLNGNVNKFVFFMRIKNAINQSKKYKVKQQMKVFLLILMQKFNKYYDFNQRKFLAQWNHNVKYRKHLENLSEKIESAAQHIDKQVTHAALENVKDTANKKKKVAKYHALLTQSFVRRVKGSFDKWKAIPNIKKAKGRVLLVKFLRNKLKETHEAQRQSYESFKEKGYEGKAKKIKFISKVFSRDALYLANFMGKWRRNISQQKFKEVIQHKQKCKQKQIALNKLLGQINKKDHLQNIHAITQFNKKRIFNLNRNKITSKYLTDIILKNQYGNSKLSFNSFLADYKQGKNKKDRLVNNLVTANKIKQGQVFVLLRTLANTEAKNQKIQRMNNIFRLLTNDIKQNLVDQLFKLSPFYRVIQKIGTNYAEQIKNSLDKIKELPPRIKWRKRTNCINLYSKLEFLVNKGAKSSFSGFKDCHSSGQFKKKRILDVMTFRYIDTAKNYFKIYNRNIREIKKNEQCKIVTKNFDSLIELTKSNFEIVLSGQKIWKKKQKYLKQLNKKVQDRMKYALKMWRENSKTLGYFSKLQDEKKKRLLSFISSALSKNQLTQSKKCIHLFRKHTKIMQLQTTFLKRLCDTQAGKASRAIMIWKNLPVPKNKELIIKASKFENNLIKYADKIPRQVFNSFKDAHYFGNQKKKLVIRKLVLKSCAGIQYYFSTWRSNNQLTTLFQKTHSLDSMAQIVMNIQQNNFSYLFQGNISQQVQRSFQKIEKWWQNKQRLYLNKWRNKIKRLALDDQIKKKNLLILTGIQEKCLKNKVHQMIRAIKLKSFLRQVFLKYFVQHRKNKVHSIFKQMNNLPDWKRKLRQNAKRATIRSIVEKVNNEKRKDLNKVFEIFRSNRYTGNFRKYKACDQYLKDKVSQVHNILKDWNYMAISQKKQEKYKGLQALFNSLFEASRSNFSQIMSNARDMQLKKKSIQRLLRTQQIKTKGYIRLWFDRTKQIKVQQQFSNHKKKLILQRINTLLLNSNGKNVKKTILKFSLNYKIGAIQTKFLNRLMQTKSGKVVNAFNKWKEIPNQNMMQKYKKGQKFFFKLQKMVKGKLGETQQAFKSNGDHGNSMKKQSVLQLLDITSIGIRRFYNRWSRITKRDHAFMQASTLMNFMDSMSNAISQNYLIVFEDEKSVKIKTWAIQKLIQSSGKSQGFYFKAWRENVRQLKIKQAMNQQQKQVALKAFSKILGNSEKGQVIHTIQQFKKNLHITKISRNFINRLLRTKSGKVIQLFELWRSIPNVKVASRKKKAIKFESKLNIISQRFMKRGFQPFKNYSHEARNKKRLCIQRLIRASMGEQKKKFYIWREIVKEEKIFTHTDLFDRVFKIMRNTAANSVQIMTRDTGSEIQKKKGLCRKLINNSNFVQHHAYFIWKEALQTDNLKIQKQENKAKISLVNLINIEKKVANINLLQVIDKFKQIRNKKNQQVADIQKQNKNRTGLLFYDKISTFVLSKASCFFEGVKNAHEQHQFLVKAKGVDKSFENMNNVFSENFYIAMRSNRQTIIIQKSLNRLLTNLTMSTQKAFDIWRQNKNILNLESKMTHQKKKNILDVINKLVTKNQSSQIPFVIKKFEKNYKQIKLQRQILGKILQTKAGKVPLSFMLWKSMPNPKGRKIKQKAIRFQSALFRVSSNRLKATYQKFKDSNNTGISKKRFAVNKLVVATMSDSNRYFNKWRKTSHQQKITSKMITLNRIFEISEDIFKNNLVIIDKNSNMENSIKIKAINKLYSNQFKNYQLGFQTWRNNIIDNDYNFFVNTLTKYDQSHFRKRNLSIALQNIKKKAELQTVRTYINSLWKWKMSNFEANYYGKFIKMFKQSQELLTLSNCLNKKKYQNMHSAFRSILQVGADRRNRKIRITEKYMMRKVQNYFNRFKMNTCFTTIQLWKSTYTQTVKAKNMTNILEAIIRKQALQVFSSLKQNWQSQIKAEKMVQKLNKVIEGFKVNAFSTMYRHSYGIFITRVETSIGNIKLRNYRESLENILSFGKTTQIVAKIGKISQRYNLRTSFSKINMKAHRNVKVRLGLRFLAEIQNQTEKLKRKSIIKDFKTLNDKAHNLRNIFNMLSLKKNSNLKELYIINNKQKNRQLLLNRFRKGMLIKKIIDSQDKKLMKKMFDRFKKKQNIWIENSINKLVLRSHIKSSLAVSLWRFKCHAKKSDI